MKFFIFWTIATMAVASALPESAEANNPDCGYGDAPDIVDVATQANLTSLVQAIQAAGLVSTVQGLSGVTVFAPTNDAFAALGDISKIPQATLQTVLKYHVVQTLATKASLRDGQQVPTLEGCSVTIHVNGDSVTINDAKVLKADVQAKQGIVHVIDKVLMPPASHQP